jgi:hypothetical protein
VAMFVGRMLPAKLAPCCNFKVNLITHLEVIALFSSNLKKKKYFSSFISKTIRDRC